MDETESVLDKQSYRTSEVDMLLGLPLGTARRWVDGSGRPSRPVDPLIRAERLGSSYVTWGEFVSARLIAEYRYGDVDVAKLAPLLRALEAAFGTAHPLALQQTFAGPDGLALVHQAQLDTGVDPRLWLVVPDGEGLAVAPGVERFLKVARYGDDQVVRRLVLDGAVGVHPEIMCGQPTIVGTRIPARTIAAQIRMGESYESVMHAWDMSRAVIEDAVHFCSDA